MNGIWRRSINSKLAEQAHNNTRPSSSAHKNIVLITGATGNIGRALSEFLASDFRVVGLDRSESADITCDITSPKSMDNAILTVKEWFGERVAAVIHLAAYFDFTGEKSPLYDEVNVKGTKNLLDALTQINVEHFIYASTILVHKPGKPGELIAEQSPLGPKWAYPESKASAENVIIEHTSKIPFTILRLAGLYDDEVAVPTLAHQISRIYERNPKSVLHTGDSQAGQAFIHREDLLDLFKAVITKRKDLDSQNIFLAGEASVISYRELQHQIGKQIHGESEWATFSVPEPLAKVGAWVEDRSEPVIPDDLDEGERPFIKPFMIDMASDHYELNIEKIERTLGWTPKHRIQTSLPKLIHNLKANPIQWYENNGIKVPAWFRAAKEKNKNPEELREQYEVKYLEAHKNSIWAPFVNMGLGAWLLSSPFTLGYNSSAMCISDIVSGMLVCIFACMSLSAKPLYQLSRWGLGVVAMWLMFAPLIFWSPSAAAYLNNTIIGGLVFGFALLVRPFPRLASPVASETGPSIPPGWEFSPSDWFQRLPIILLAFVGFFISRYLTAYQLEHIDGVWEPFFGGAIDNAKNGTEEIITSSVSKAWPVPDAGLGALTYLLEILTGVIGSRNRWRTMPWLVLFFGFMIIPLGAISITFIIIQPIVLDTWCTLCLIAAAAMLIQIPYSFDEIVATIQFLKRRAQAGQPWMLILFTGDTDEPNKIEEEMANASREKHSNNAKHGLLPQSNGNQADNFAQSPSRIFKECVLGGVTLPWNLAICAILGIWLMFTRITLNTTGAMANADHLIGALILTITITACAEVMRPIRFVNIFLGMALLITPFVLSAGIVSILASGVVGLAIIVCSLPKGSIGNKYGSWSRYIV